MSRPGVAVVHDYHSRAADLADWGQVRAQADVRFLSQRFRDQDEVVEALADVEIVCAMRELLAFDDALLARLPRLKLIVATGESNRLIDFDAADARGVEVAGTPNGIYGRVATAELTWGLILAATRNIVEEDRQTRSGQWQTSLPRVLHGRTLGLVGLGRIGRIIARYARAFGMHTLAWSPRLTAASALEDLVEYVPFEDLLARSDVVSLHLVLGPDNEGLIDRRAFSLMKPGSILVNTARGPLVDEQALLDALAEGPIAGAALDVYDREPLEPGHPLFERRNVVLSPHLAGFTEETLREWYAGTVEAVTAYLAGRAPVVRHSNRLGAHSAAG